jgi:hypothetical protein
MDRRKQLKYLKKFIREQLDTLNRNMAGFFGGADMGGPVHMGKPAWQLGSSPEDEPSDAPEYEDVPASLAPIKPQSFVKRNKKRYNKNIHGQRSRRRN